MNVNEMHAAQKLAISSGHNKDAFSRTIRGAQPKGYTQNGLARALGIPPSLLSMYRNRERPIPRSRAEKIERLTGWAATTANWLGGIVDDA